MLPAVSPLPTPPRALLDASSPISGGGHVAPAPDLGAWVAAEILAPNRPLSNYDHAHLAEGGAVIGWLWSTEVLAKQGRRVLGRCALGHPTGDAWVQAARRDQLLGWFGSLPDFVVILDAWFFAHAVESGNAADALAVVDHELYHCGQERDGDGEPRYTQDGDPVWGIRPHDVEEFGGVVRRWGIEASAARPLVEAIDHVRAHGPDIARSTLDGVCGTGR